jgi:hypothetical protein
LTKVLSRRYKSDHGRTDTIPPFDLTRLNELMAGDARWVLGPWFVDELAPDDYDIVDCTVANHPGPHVEETIATFSGCNHDSVENAKLVAYVMTHLHEIVRLAKLGMGVDNPEVLADMVAEDLKAAAKNAILIAFAKR